AERGRAEEVRRHFPGREDGDDRGFRRLGESAGEALRGWRPVRPDLRKEVTVSGFQAITDAGFGVQQPGSARISLELLAEPVYELLQELPVSAPPMTPDVREQPLCRNHVPRLCDEDLQQ